MSKKTFVIFGLLVVFLAVADPLARPSAPTATPTAGAQKVARRPEGRPGAVPDQLRHLPHALRGRHRRQLRPEPRRTAGAHRPADGRAPQHDQSDRRTRPQRDRKRRRQHHDPGPDARRHPQRRAGRRSRRIRRPHRRRGLISARHASRFCAYRGCSWDARHRLAAPNASEPSGERPHAHNRVGQERRTRRSRVLSRSNRRDPQGRAVAGARRRWPAWPFAGARRGEAAKPKSEGHRRQRDDPQPLPRRRPDAGDRSSTSIGGFIEANGEILRAGRRTATSRSAPRAWPRRSSKRNRTWSACRRSRSGGPRRPSLGRSSSGVPIATTVKYDFLQLLLAQLNKGRARSYRGRSSSSPSSTSRRRPTPTESGDGRRQLRLENAEINGRLTMRDVILARVGAGVKTSNPKAATSPPAGRESPIAGDSRRSPAAGPASTPRCAAASKFHFVDTHLEAFDNAAELPEHPRPAGRPSWSARAVRRPSKLPVDPGRRPQLRHQDRSQARRRPGLPGAARGRLPRARDRKPTGCCIELEPAYESPAATSPRSTTRSTTS